MRTAPNKLEVTGVRGPADHAVRDQIIAAAHDYFAHYGYTKTTVADLAREIGFSKAYIYRFFESKQAIGEAICADTTQKVIERVEAALAVPNSAPDKMRLFAKELFAGCVALMFNDRKLHEIAALAARESWTPTHAYVARLEDMIKDILIEGRSSGEFERKTPLDETVRAIIIALQQFINPMLLQRGVNAPPEAIDEVLGLILRSLAP